MKKRKVTIITFLLIISLCVQAQFQNENPVWNTVYQITADMMTTPRATSIQRYLDYPVDLSVGLPEISIPFYTIQAGGLSLPLSLSYHMGGHKVDDVASWVGLGWTLNAGGAIVRSINGEPDEMNAGGITGFLHHNDNLGNLSDIKESNSFCRNYWGNSQTYDHLDKIRYFHKDGESDTYSYQVGGISGSFIYNMNREIVSVPYSDNKIIRDAQNNFKIIGDDGTVYKFNAQDTEHTKNLVSGADFYITSWLISEIISSDGIHSIKFEYGDRMSYRDYIRPTSLVSEGYHFESDRSFPDNTKLWPIQSYQQSLEWNSLERASYERSLKKITYNGGSIEFKESLTFRKDKRNNSLSEIIIRDGSGRQIKKIEFVYGHFGSSANLGEKSDDSRLKLDAVKEFGSDNSEENPLIHRFYYQTSPGLPSYYKYNPSAVGGAHPYFSQDYWGYANGAYNKNLLVIPKYSKFHSYGANRESNETNMKACILTKIEYPTGGYTMFETEANRDLSGNIFGGLRIAKITSKASGTEVVKKYEYGHCSDLKIHTPDIYYRYELYPAVEHYYVETDPSTFNRVVPYTDFGAPDMSYMRTYYSEQPHSPLGVFRGSPVVYHKVTEYSISQKDTIGKTVYQYSGVDTNMEYMKNLNEGSPYDLFPYERYHFPPHVLSWRTGKLIQKDIYKENSEAPVSTTKYKYSKKEKMFPAGEKVLSKFYSRRGSRAVEQECFPTYPDNSFPFELPSKERFDVFQVNHMTGVMQLEEVSEMTDGVTKVTKFEYNTQSTGTNSNLLLSKKIITTGNNNVIEAYKYPQDFSSVPVYRDMINKNMLSHTLEKSINNNEHIIIHKRDFDYFNSNALIRPSVESSGTKTGNGNDILRQDITYDRYSKDGNLLQYTKLDGAVTIYLWSYSGQYPIAEIRNATYSQAETAAKSAFGVTDLDALSRKISVTLEQLDNLRKHSSLKDAHVTTCTYKPLIGILTATDPSGITTYYDYDSFGRLKRTYIKEGTTEKNIQTFDYHYQNQ